MKLIGNQICLYFKLWLDRPWHGVWLTSVNKNLISVVWCIVAELPRQVLHNHYLTSSHYTSTHLLSLHLISRHLISLHPISLHLISYHFIPYPLTFYLIPLHLILLHIIPLHLLWFNHISLLLFCLQWDCGNSRALSTEWECRQFLNAGKLSMLFTAFSSPFWCTSLLGIHPHTTILITFFEIHCSTSHVSMQSIRIVWKTLSHLRTHRIDREDVLTRSPILRKMWRSISMTHSSQERFVMCVHCTALHCCECENHIPYTTVNISDIVIHIRHCQLTEVGILERDWRSRPVRWLLRDVLFVCMHSLSGRPTAVRASDHFGR